MIREVKMYSAYCDHCGKEWEDFEHGWIAMNDEMSLETVLKEEGWILLDWGSGETYCNDCFEYGENDEIVLKPNRKNKYGRR